MAENETGLMKKKDVLIILAALLIAAAGMLAVWLSGRNAVVERARIYLGADLYQEVALNEDQVIKVDQGSGVVNHIEVKDGAIRMMDSTCPDKQCVYQGEMSMENYERRGLRQWIVCLPNQVTVELVLEGGE